MKDNTEAESLTEVIRRALAVYETLVELSADERSIVIRVDDEPEQRLILVP